MGIFIRRFSMLRINQTPTCLFHTAEFSPSLSAPKIDLNFHLRFGLGQNRLIFLLVRLRFAFLARFSYLFFAILPVCFSHAAPSINQSDVTKQFPIEILKSHNDLKLVPLDGKSEVWLMVSEPGTTPVIFYAPLSIITLKDGFVSVTTLINYTSDEGNAESLLGLTLYNCASRTKQEQSTVQYSKQWADGDVLLRIGLEEPWNSVKVDTEGMRLLKTVCNLR